jgi:hypothetical protein
VVKSPCDVLSLPCRSRLRHSSVDYGGRGQRNTDKRAEKLMGVRGYALLVPPAGTDWESSSVAYHRRGRNLRDVFSHTGPAEDRTGCEAYASIDVREKLLFHDNFVHDAVQEAGPLRLRSQRREFRSDLAAV